LSKALVQYCWAHLIRDIKFLLTLGHKTLKRWAEGLLKVLRKIFELWKTRYRRHQGRYEKAIAKLKKAFLRKVRRPPSHNEAVNIKKRFIDGVDKCYFLFLEREGVNPTNNLSEQAIRFVVIDRRITQGTRSWTTKETKGMIKGEHFRLLPDGAVFINTARGAIVNEQEMIEELKKKRFVACLDATDPEPPIENSPLRTLPNVILTPHQAGVIAENMLRMGTFVADEIEAFVNGRPQHFKVLQHQLRIMG